VYDGDDRAYKQRRDNVRKSMSPDSEERGRETEPLSAQTKVQDRRSPG
jgi:hypothetical protein